MKSALGNYFNSPESQQQPKEGAEVTDGAEDPDGQMEEVEEEGMMEVEMEGEVKFKKSPVHEQYQPTQPLVASFILNQVSSRRLHHRILLPPAYAVVFVCVCVCVCVFGL